MGGSFQIYRAKEGGWSSSHATNWQAHRIFGWFDIFFVCAHICMMAVMTYENPVNQHLIILVGYVGMICNAISNLLHGIEYARMAVRSNDQEEKRTSVRKHTMYMFFLYVRSTMGSGSIRIAAWALLLVGHFLS
jgi:hypothetical protein